MAEAKKGSVQALLKRVADCAGPYRFRSVPAERRVWEVACSATPTLPHLKDTEVLHQRRKM